MHRCPSSCWFAFHHVALVKRDVTKEVEIRTFYCSDAFVTRYLQQDNCNAPIRATTTAFTSSSSSSLSCQGCLVQMIYTIAYSLHAQYMRPGKRRCQVHRPQEEVFFNVSSHLANHDLP